MNLKGTDLGLFCDINTLHRLIADYESGIDDPASALKEWRKIRYKNQVIRTSGEIINWPQNLGDVIRQQWRMQPAAKVAAEMYNTSISCANLGDRLSAGINYDGAFANQVMQNFNLARAKRYAQNVIGRLNPGATFFIVSKARPKRMEDLARKVDVISDLSSDERTLAFVEDKRILPAISRMTKEEIKEKDLIEII